MYKGGIMMVNDKGTVESAGFIVNVFIKLEL